MAQLNSASYTQPLPNIHCRTTYSVIPSYRAAANNAAAAGSDVYATRKLRVRRAFLKTVQLLM